jgi:hypothetical protein
MTFANAERAMPHPLRWTLAALIVGLAACTSVPSPSAQPSLTALSPTATPTPVPAPPSSVPTTFRFDVENHASVGVVVSVVSDVAAWLPGFEPGQSGTILIALGNAQNGILIEIQDGKCGLLAKASYPTPTSFTLIVEDASTAGTVRLSTREGIAPTSLPLPSNDLQGCGG